MSGYTTITLRANDYDCDECVEVRTAPDGGYVEIRFRAPEGTEGVDEDGFGDWRALSSEIAGELAAALMVAAHFCEEANQSLRNAAPLRELTERLIAKVAEPSA